MDYPLEAMKKSNFNNRPLGIGVSGSADTFKYMRYPFDSPESRQLNREIFETMYHAAVEAS